MEGEPPTIAVSHRPGHGYDLHALAASASRPLELASSPPGLEATHRSASRGEQERNEALSVEARMHLLEGYDPVRRQLPPRLLRHLEGVDALYIPGGQDIPSRVPFARDSRITYEAALMDVARQRGIPVLAICGGSRRLAAAYGVAERDLEGGVLDTHQQSGTAAMSHGLTFPTPHSILGSAPGERGPLSEVDRINSTHSKVADSEWPPVVMPGTTPLLRGVERVTAPHHNPILFGSAMRSVETRETPLLQITAMDPRHHTPEGFETAFGVPHIGVTSHPEAIAGGSSAAMRGATPAATAWSRHVMNAFQEAAQARRNRRAMNAEFRGIDPASRLRPTTVSRVGESGRETITRHEGESIDRFVARSRAFRGG